MEVIYNPYRYKQGIQANTASVMHGRFQHHSPTDTEGQVYKHLSSDTDMEYLWTECEMPPAHSVLLGPQAVVLSGRLWKHCNLGVNWLPRPRGEPASNLSLVTCALHSARACYCCHAVPARMDCDS